MPISHNVMLRYQALDACFSDRGKYYFIENLLDAVNKLLANNCEPPVSKRTIQYDIRKMESNHDWVVVFEEPALKEGRRGLPQFNRVEELISDLEKQYDFTLPDSMPMMEFDNNEYLEGLKFLVQLLGHIMNRQPLNITYRPFGKDPFIVVCHPYFLKQFNRRWFLFALDHQHRNISNYPIDRIGKVTKAKQKFIPSEYDFTEYFDNVIGVTNTQDKPERVVLRFTEKRLPYVLSKPLHHSQKFQKSDSTVTVKVVVNKELTQLLLSFGADVDVLEPAPLQPHLRQVSNKGVI